MLMITEGITVPMITLIRQAMKICTGVDMRAFNMNGEFQLAISRVVRRIEQRTVVTPSPKVKYQNRRKIFNEKIDVPSRNAV